MQIERHDHNADFVTYRISGNIGKQYVEAKTHAFMWEEAAPVFYDDYMPSKLVLYVRRFPEGPDNGWKEATFSQNKKVQKILSRRISRDIPNHIFAKAEKLGFKYGGKPSRRE